MHDMHAMVYSIPWPNQTVHMLVETRCNIFITNTLHKSCYSCIFSAVDAASSVLQLGKKMCLVGRRMPGCAGAALR